MTGKNYFLVEFGPPAEAGGLLFVLRGPSLVPDFSISSLGTTDFYLSALTDKVSGTYLSYFPVKYQRKPQKPGLSSNIVTLGTIEEIVLADPLLRGPSLVPDFSISSLGTTSLYHSALTDKTSGTYLSYFPVRYQKKPQKPGLSSNIMTLGTIEEIELNCLVHQILRQRIFTALIGHD